ncbi:MAG: hypothetical protein B9S32_04710 [Verrucomicrobia bacterium Tous-C9LFEB]|nr:MAG: hypothetical protein B9S32_04710 [Verrucomicrobia bacterium Tous-C9LFEB]
MALVPEGFYQCPFGFTSYSFYFLGQHYTITGIVAFPRFETENERQVAKRHPEIKTTRNSVSALRQLFADAEKLRADTIAKAAQVFPQAFHELRKLNGAIIQYAEKDIRNGNYSDSVKPIHSAAELMRNNFDILEALSNIDSMRALPISATINVFDLIYKTKKVYTEKAAGKKMSIQLNGERAIIHGSQKSFPTVPAVLIENAIKYGKAGTLIKIDVVPIKNTLEVRVTNESEFPIDPTNCFNRGSRYAGDSVEGGGFGLFLAREIILAHKGTIRCERLGHCINMIVHLPLKEVMPKDSIF